MRSSNSQGDLGVSDSNPGSHSLEPSSVSKNNELQSKDCEFASQC